MADKELYRACAVEVKRQIWQDNQALFGDEVSPLLKQYILEKENALFSTELSVLHNFFSPSPKARRQGEVRPGCALTLPLRCPRWSRHCPLNWPRSASALPSLLTVHLGEAWPSALGCLWAPIPSSHFTQGPGSSCYAACIPAREKVAAG